MPSDRRPSLPLVRIADQKTKPRSVTLIRLAINLGFSAGPALGGLIIGAIGYYGLFWIDGGSCILAGLLLIFVLNPKKAKVLDTVENDQPKSAYTDKTYWVFILAMMLFGFVFVQYFSTIPLYYNEARALSEYQIGLAFGHEWFPDFCF